MYRVAASIQGKTRELPYISIAPDNNVTTGRYRRNIMSENKLKAAATSTVVVLQQLGKG